MSRLLKYVLALVVTALSVASLMLVNITPSKALSGSEWSAGNIISDDQFFKSSAMSTTEIQNFLNSMVPVCDTNGTRPSEFGGGTRAQYGASIGYPAPYTCLKDYAENPTTHQNNANGGTVTGGWSSAQIIKYASDTYGVSPKVLLVLLQKEQTLVTDTWPFPTQYRSATGYGCPDTAPCDAEYYGLYNQVVNAARQFQLYAKYPNNYRYKAFQANSIQWNPSSSCGASAVYIANQATAGLYNYTPYQPNAAALNNLYGSGDSCSAYGNRNFWRLYNDWFGSTQISETFIEYKAHVSGIGWQGYKGNSGVMGTTGQSRAIEAFTISGEVEYSSYSNTTGWQPTVSNGVISGTIEQSRALSALKISPKGSLAARYDLYYRVHVNEIGWLDWTMNGQTSGVTGDSSKRIEAVEIRLVVKGYGVTGSTINPYLNHGTTVTDDEPKINLQSHIAKVGWQPGVTDGMVSGTTGQGIRMEALRASILNAGSISGALYYSSHIQDSGWQAWSSDGELSGTTGQSKRLEAVRISLTEGLADSYDVWYRVHVAGHGWLGWTKNGKPAGTIGKSLQMEALETRLTPKGASSPVASRALINDSTIPVPQTASLSYKSHLSFMGWTGASSTGQVSGTTGQSRPLEALTFTSISSVYGTLHIECSAYVRSTGWTPYARNNAVCGTTGQSRPLEAVKLRLLGEAANKYSIEYSVHSSQIGWSGTYGNDVAAGTPSTGKHIEAVMVRLVEK